MKRRRAAVILVLVVVAVGFFFFVPAVPTSTSQFQIPSYPHPCYVGVVLGQYPAVSIYASFSYMVFRTDGMAYVPANGSLQYLAGYYSTLCS
jgi:hypothetical protein